MINMKATSTTKKVVTTFINVDLGYNNDEEKRAIMNFCQQISKACDYDATIIGQVVTNIVVGHPHFVSAEGDYDITIK